MSKEKEPKELQFKSSGETFPALYFENGNKACIVMAHGFGAIKEGLLPQAEIFKDKYDVLLFDYRHFGSSDAKPRLLVDIKKQLEDWENIVKWAKERYEKVALFGSSFSGGHVLITASKIDVDAVISQVPCVDGISTTIAIAQGGGIMNIVILILSDILDLLLDSLIGKSYRVPFVSSPKKIACMNTADSLKYLEVVPEKEDWENFTPARVILSIPSFRAIDFVEKIKCPVLYIIGEKDSLCPAQTTLKAARKTKNAEVFKIDGGHFDPYKNLKGFPDHFEECMKVQMDFLSKTLGT